MHHVPTPVVGAATILGSLFIAFGPFRHRVPRIFRVGAKYSAAIKLTVLAIIAGIAFYHGIRTEGDQGGDAAYGVATFVLAIAAAYILTRAVSRRAESAGATPGATGGTRP